MVRHLVYSNVWPMLTKTCYTNRNAEHQRYLFIGTYQARWLGINLSSDLFELTIILFYLG
jgi:hypothetical protein